MAARMTGVVASAVSAGTLPTLSKGQKVFAIILAASFTLVGLVLTRALIGAQSREIQD